MSQTGVMGPAHVRRRLASLADRSLNFDRGVLRDGPPPGWRHDDIRQSLPPEAPGAPAARGSFEIAKRLIWGYEFADPSIVRAYYDPQAPLLGRNMVLRLRALALVSVYVGVRVLEVIDDPARELGGRTAQVWGWRYGTLQGHVEQGEMSWEVWKWHDSGAVDFRVHAVSRAAPIRDPIIRIGFRLFGPHERTVFLRSTRDRMATFTELALSRAGAQPVRDAAKAMTARPLRESEPHDQLARSVLDPDRERR